MVEFAYSLVDDSPIDGEMYWVRAAADEIHDYTRANEPLLIVPGRSQTFNVLRTLQGLPRYPLVGEPSRVYYRKGEIGGDAVDLDAGDDYEIVADGKVMSFAAKHEGRQIHVDGDAGWGRSGSLGMIEALLAQGERVLPASGLSVPGAGAVLRIGVELMLVTAERADGNFDVTRGIAGTSAAEHASGETVARVRAPDLLEAAARGIASALKVRNKEPGRGAARPVQVQSGFRLVRTDPLAVFRRDLDEYRR